MKKRNPINKVKKLTLMSVLAFSSLAGNAQTATNVFDDIILLSADHTTLTTAITTAGLESALQNPAATLTVFAPTNAAFDQVAADLGTDIAGLLALPNLSDILLYHVLGSKVAAADINNGDIVTPLNTSNTIKLTKTGTGMVYANHANVTTADLTADNGFVHVVDAVILANETVADIAIDNGFTSLTTAVITAELLPALTNPFSTLTVFAPTNPAFDSVAANLGTDIAGLLALPNLSDILLYHVLGSKVAAADINNGDLVTPLNTSNTIKLTKTGTGMVYANHANVTTADLTADNGFVHVVDAVILANETVADIAIDNGFTSLTTAVITAELLPALTNPFSTLTVFAPTNAAFDSVAANLGTDIAGLLALPNLSDILLYHVLGSKVAAADINNGDLVTPLNTSNTIKLTKTGAGMVYANHANVTTADLTADNGFVHVVDAVILANETVADIAIDNGFTSLTTAVITAELLPALTNPFSTLTVFAPTNEAFDSVAANLGTDIAGLLALPNLSDILLYHVLGSKVTAADINNGDLVTPLNTSNTIKLTKTGAGMVYANHANVTTADLTADNGFVHVVDAVILANETVADIAIDNGFTSLTTAVITAELLPTLTNPFSTLTVFAPTNEAFDSVAANLGTDIAGLLALPNLSDILVYHVLGSKVAAADINNGDLVTPLNTSNTIKLTKTGAGMVYANHANVTTADLTADNGFVHVVDAVILANETVADIAIDNGFTSLTTAVITAELLPALTNPFSTLTVFAPTNAAFDSVASALGTDIAGLLALPNLSDILLYHVLGSKVAAADINNGDIVTPLNSSNTIKLTKTGAGMVYANHANVTTADLTADNGFVHVVDAVILANETVADIAIDNGFTSLTTAVIKAELLPALSNPFSTLTVFAPTNAAFDLVAAKLGTDINGLLALPDLSDILLYHVLGSKVAAADINNGDLVTPLNTSNTIKLTKTGAGLVYANHGKVVTADISADNGMVHVIDAVIFDNESVVDIAIDNGFTSLTTAVITAELLPALTNTFSALTVFAPTNAAFDSLAADLGTDLAGLLALPNLSDILLYHVLGIKVASTDISNGDIVTPLNTSNTIKLTKTGTGMVYVNHAKVATTDLSASNGFVHVIDAVILANETVVDIAIDNGFTSLTTAVVTAELLPALTNPLSTLTVFAPTNAAFDQVAADLGTNTAGLLALPNLSDILLYHVLGTKVASADISNGDIVTPLNTSNTIKLTKTRTGMVYVNHAKVATADLSASNGFVHVIDAVILANETVVDIAIDNGFTSLTTAVITAELLPALIDPFASLTVFAPTNAAFDQVAADLGTDIAGLLASPDLTDILLYHVLNTKVLSTDLSDGSVETLNGQDLIIDLTNSTVKINSSTVTSADLTAENGVVHVIDAVLVPQLTSVGTEEIEPVSFNMYPNPTTDFVIVRSTTDIETISLVNSQGQIVYSMQVNGNETRIDVGSYAAGQYFVRVESVNASIAKMIIIAANN